MSFFDTAVVVAGKESLTAFQATENVRRHFCSSCGAHVYTADKRLPAMVGVPAGALDGSSDGASDSAVALTPSAHYFVNHRAAWHAISDALPQFGGESGYAQRVPKTLQRNR